MRRRDTHAASRKPYSRGPSRSHGGLRRGGDLLGGLLPGRRSRRADQRLPLQRRSGRDALALLAGAVGPRAFDFNSLHLPADRDKLRFEQRGGKLRNLLDRTVPELAAGAVGRLWSGRGPRPVARVVAHPGGRDVLEAVAPVVAPHSLDASARTLRDNGNMSSASVLFALEEALAEAGPAPDGDFWLVSFGAGFSAHSCRLGR